MTTTIKKFNWDSVRQRLAQSQAQIDDAEYVDRDRLHDIFRQRASQLAGRQRQAVATTSRIPVVVFRIKDERYGIELTHLEQVFPRLPITPVPGTCQLILGLANLNGALRSVVDLSLLLRVPTTCTEGHIALLRAAGRSLAVRVETFERVCEIDLNALAPMDEASSASTGRFMRGMTDNRIIVLDAKALIEHVAEQVQNRGA